MKITTPSQKKYALAISHTLKLNMEPSFITYNGFLFQDDSSVSLIH
jgi:hypothetical protein